MQVPQKKSPSPVNLRAQNPKDLTQIPCNELRFFCLLLAAKRGKSRWPVSEESVGQEHSHGKQRTTAQAVAGLHERSHTKLLVLRSAVACDTPGPGTLGPLHACRTAKGHEASRWRKALVLRATCGDASTFDAGAVGRRSVAVEWSHEDCSTRLHRHDIQLFLIHVSRGTGLHRDTGGHDGLDGGRPAVSRIPHFAFHCLHGHGRRRFIGSPCANDDEVHDDGSLRDLSHDDAIFRNATGVSNALSEARPKPIKITAGFSKVCGNADPHLHHGSSWTDGA